MPLLSRWWVWCWCGAARGAAAARAEAVLGGFFCVEDCAAMFADCYAGLHLFAAGGAIGEAGGHVGPFAFDAERDRSAAVQI